MTHLKFNVSFFFLFAVLSAACAFADSQRPDTPKWEHGTIVAASPDWEHVFYGTPSMEIMADGTYVFTHD